MSYYYDTKKWAFNTEGVGVKVPLWFVILMLPLLGALFVVFLPVIGFVVTGYALHKWLNRKLQGFWHLVFTRSPEPGAAYLTGKKGGGAGTDALKALEKEIEKRRLTE